jgi:hypothetical protein
MLCHGCLTARRTLAHSVFCSTSLGIKAVRVYSALALALTCDVLWQCMMMIVKKPRKARLKSSESLNREQIKRRLLIPVQGCRYNYNQSEYYRYRVIKRLKNEVS